MFYENLNSNENYQPTTLKREMDWSNLYEWEIPFSLNGLSVQMSHKKDARLIWVKHVISISWVDTHILLYQFSVILTALLHVDVINVATSYIFIRSS